MPIRFPRVRDEANLKNDLGKLFFFGWKRKDTSIEERRDENLASEKESNSHISQDGYIVIKLSYLWRWLYSF